MLSVILKLMRKDLKKRGIQCVYGLQKMDINQGMVIHMSYIIIRRMKTLNADLS